MEFDENKYFLGKLCRYGHKWNDAEYSLRYKSTKGCVECKKNANKQYFHSWWVKLKQQNPEKAKKHSIAWQKKYPAKARAQQKQWRQQNPEKIKEYSKKYYKKKFEEYRLYQREYYLKNKEKFTKKLITNNAE